MKEFFIFTLLFMTLSCYAQNLTIQLKGNDNKPPNIKKAEMLISYWSDNERLPLQTEKDKVFIDLTQEWFKKTLKKREPDQIMAVNIYIESDSHAPVLSDPFTPPCVNSPNTATTHTVSFQTGPEILIEPGRNASLVLAVRKKEPRIIKVIDQSGNPLKGVGIYARMAWSYYNHCGTVEDTDPLGCWTTNNDGNVTIPDGDIYYEMEFNKPDYFLAAPKGNYGQDVFSARLKEPMTTFTMKKRRNVLVKLQVTRDGQPVSGLKLVCCARNCPCGGCCGTLANVDADGMATSNLLCPDLMDELFLADEKGTVLWKQPIDQSYEDREYKIELSGLSG